MRVSRWWAFPAALIGAFLLQLTVVPFVAVHWVKPDLILVVAILGGLLYGPNYGAVAGLFGGLLEDLFIGHYIGLFGLTRMLAGFLAGLVETRVYREPFLVPMATSFAATLVGETILGLLLKAFGANPSLGKTFTNVILPAAVYNAIIAPIVYRPLRRLKKETESGMATKL
ncbi:MAG TPA: rod shape-determining protein MreD [Bacillota bacterium]|jgi:rod shape-determining protein MreD